MTVYVDVTEFLRNPVRTGIQRVCGELCRWWPGDDLVPVALSANSRLVPLPSNARSVIRSYFEAGPDDLPKIREVISQIADDSRQSQGEIDSYASPIVVPEVFYDPKRIEFFQTLLLRQYYNVYFIFYDALPITHPQYFPPQTSYETIEPYFRLVRHAKHVGFISRSTRDVFCQRLLRRSDFDGPVLRLGSDSMGEPSPRPGNPGLKFTVVGTIEPRKQHALVLDAFERLFPEMPDLSLTFIGRMGWIQEEAAARIRKLAQSIPQQFTWIERADDRVIKETVCSSRATLYLSATEGYGLPPVESLHLGVPVVATRNIPSLEEVHGGVWFVDADPIDVRRAVVALCHDSTYVRLRKECEQLRLPTWRSFSEQVRQWCLNAQSAK